MTEKPSVAVPHTTGIGVLDNVARISDDGVDIYDRRAHPFDERWVHCMTSADVAQAIVDMVTQSHGPAVAAGYGMALAARHAILSDTPWTELRKSANELIATRPTNNSLRNMVTAILNRCRIESPSGWEQLATAYVNRHLYLRQIFAEDIGRYGAALFGAHTRLLTHCWAETGLSQIVQRAVADGKVVEAFCAETRPYLQGSRLTADALRDAGAIVTVIPDAAVAYMISESQIDLIISGSDRVTADGGVVNKIGTLTIAALAHRFRVPFYTICTDFDRETSAVDSVEIEVREGSEILQCRGHRTATSGVAGFYPAFDRTPADLVAGYITPDGVMRYPQLAKWEGSGQ
jgi:methylthioribose-1-phosphate isomerase